MLTRSHAARTLGVLALAAAALIGLRPAGATPDGAQTATAPAAAQPPTTEEYVGVAPCRLVDTRQTSILDGTTRRFTAAGNLAAQGGNASGCDIPTHATSIAVNLTGITTTPGGFLRGWAADAVAPNATLLNYAPAINASNMVNIPLCQSQGCSAEFNLRNFVGDVHVVADVLGYYQSPTFAQVSSSGAIIASSGVTGVTQTGASTFDVTFDRRIDTCGFSAIANDVTNNRVVSAIAPSGTTVRVIARDTANAPQPTAFTLTVTC